MLFFRCYWYMILTITIFVKCTFCKVCLTFWCWYCIIPIARHYSWTIVVVTHSYIWHFIILILRHLLLYPGVEPDMTTESSLDTTEECYRLVILLQNPFLRKWDKPIPLVCTGTVRNFPFIVPHNTIEDGIFLIERASRPIVCWSIIGSSL